MHLWCLQLEPFREIYPAISNSSEGGKIISDVNNTAYEVKILTFQHKHVKAWPRPKFASISVVR